MNRNLHNRLIYNLVLGWKKEAKGFTLIELITTMLFMSALTVIAYPSFTNQVGKARESESKMIMGGIARNEQVYHYEKKTFTSDLNLLEIKYRKQYHNYVVVSVTNPNDLKNLVKIQVIPKNAQQDQVRNFAVGVYFNNGNYGVSICQSATVGVPVDVGNTPTDGCTNNGVTIY
jgi:type IV pilus assembly protein PilA